MAGTDLGRELTAALHELADDLEMSTAVFARALIAGAISRGIAADLAIQAMEKGLVKAPKRRMRPALPWEFDGEFWHYGPWTLVREGDPRHNENNKLPGEGWYLHGPGLVSPRDLKTMNRSKATDAANEYIAANT